jgi:hypothetical protein
MTTLSKIVLSVATIFAVADISFAQSYSLVPNDTIHMVGMMEDLETLSIQQQNTSTDTIQLKWQKVSESVPPIWEANVCDNAFCNTSLVDSGTMNPVLPSEYGLLLLHITPHKNYGTAVVRYAVWDIANPALKDTLTYILTVNTSSGISDAENKNAFSIFPNPAKEYINIISKLQTGFHYVITDVSGKEIGNGISKTNSISISTSDLPNGVYSVSIFTENKIINTKKILVQK